MMPIPQWPALRWFFCLALLISADAHAASVTLAWNASVTPPPVTGYEVHYGLSSRTYTSMLNTGQATSATIAGLKDGTRYYFGALAFNAEGDSPFSNEVNYLTPGSSGDTTPPTVTLTAPAHGSNVNRRATVTIKANASDNIVVAQVVFSVNGVLTCTDQVAPYTCAWRVPGGARKTYTLQAKATDSAANVGLSAVVSVSSH
jgi:hypothetical protein